MALAARRLPRLPPHTHHYTVPPQAWIPQPGHVVAPVMAVLFAYNLTKPPSPLAFLDPNCASGSDLDGTAVRPQFHATTAIMSAALTSAPLPECPAASAFVVLSWSARAKGR